MLRPTICQAIRDKHLLGLSYEGRFRKVEPHAYGIDQDGDELLRAWQRSPVPAGWRMFRLDRTTGLSLLATQFSQPRPDYRRDDKAMVRVYCGL